MDHACNLGVLQQDIPIVAPPESMAILKGMQDTDNTSLDTTTMLILLSGSPMMLKVSTWPQPMEIIWVKDFYCTELSSDGLLSLLSSRPGQDAPKARKKLEPGIFE